MSLLFFKIVIFGDHILAVSNLLLGRISCLEFAFRNSLKKDTDFREGGRGRDGETSIGYVTYVP